MKKIYSLNLISFLMQEGFTPRIGKEPDEELYFASFPETAEVQEAINKWKNADLQVQIHQYLNSYKELRSIIRKMREG